MSQKILLPQHKALIEASAIADGVAEGRGYWSAQRKAELLELGFTSAQALAPALVIPVHGTTGALATYQARPDQPRCGRDGKPLKYETPGGSRLVLDVPPSCRARLRDKDVPLWITEGARKADAAVSKDLCCVAILGVWAWRGTDDGGKAALPDWDDVVLADRQVFLCFDSDVVRNRRVHQALGRLRAFLERRGATVQYVILPETKPGEKVGLDDYFAGRGSVAELLELFVRDALPPVPPADVELGPYLVDPGHGVWWKTFGKGGQEELHQLANFSAEIVAEVHEDDGLEQHQAWEVRCVQGEREASVTVELETYRSCSWATQALGARARVFPGRDTRDRLADAVQAVSSRIVRRQDRYTHTGWRRTEEHGWVYLSAGACLGARGPVDGIDVRLPQALALFELPEPDPSRLREDLEASLYCWDVHAYVFSVAPWLLIWRAALGGLPIDFSLWLTGKSGWGKSEESALCQQHFGPRLVRTALPANWENTANGLEVLTFAAKDALLVIDEFVPDPTNPRQSQELMAKAARVVGSVGNVSGRARMRRDRRGLELERCPRGAILVTGEELVGGYSKRARTLTSRIPHEIDWRMLTDLQAAGRDGAFARVMSSFLSWLAPRREALVGAAQLRRLKELRDQLSGLASHHRTPENLAQLALGWNVFKAWAVDQQLRTAQDLERLEQVAWRALGELGAAQAAIQQEADPVQVFLSAVRSALVSGAAHLAGVNGRVPNTDPGRWGWRATNEGKVDQARRLSSMFGGQSGGHDEEDPDQLPTHWEPIGTRIGHVDEGAQVLHLLPHAAYAAIARMTPIALSEASLWRQMHERGMLVGAAGGERHGTLQNRLGALDRPRVYSLRAEVLFGDEPGQPRLLQGGHADPAP